MVFYGGDDVCDGFEVDGFGFDLVMFYFCNFVVLVCCDVDDLIVL